MGIFRRIFFIISFSFAGVGIALGILFAFRPDLFSFISESKRNLTPASYPWPPLAVIIENELLARPWQVGLSKADRVYEAPTEGGITRFLALFMSDEYEGKLGPVRSARSYFLDWAHEYNPLFVHVGGHFDALARLRKEDIFNADQFIYEDYFWRENVGKTALEHTMFTTVDTLHTLAKDQGWIWNKPLHISEVANKQKFNLDSSPYAQKIYINFGFFTYHVNYEYDEISKTYRRFQAKKPHIDNLSNTQLNAGAVIIQHIKAWSNGDISGSISMKTIGEGDATIFIEGRVITGRWKKNSLKEPTQFFDTYGAEIPLSTYGPLWIEILPITNTFSYN